MHNWRENEDSNTESLTWFSTEFIVGDIKLPSFFLDFSRRRGMSSTTIEWPAAETSWRNFVSFEGRRRRSSAWNEFIYPAILSVIIVDWDEEYICCGRVPFRVQEGAQLFPMFSKPRHSQRPVLKARTDWHIHLHMLKGNVIWLEERLRLQTHIYHGRIDPHRKLECPFL